MKALVIGFGSIGSRHARLLASLGLRTAVVSNRIIGGYPSYKHLADALTAEDPNYVVVSNATDQHHQTLLALSNLGFNGIVLIEKPLFHQLIEFSPNSFSKTFVAYNLRFHPVIRRLRTTVLGERVISVQAYVGQYLPNWRPATDFRQSYSAHAGRGGGVLMDLSHELDYLTLLFGKWRRLSAIGGRFSDLAIYSDDVFALLMETSHCPVVSLQMNYLDRATHRSLLVNTSKHTIEADLITGEFRIDGENEILALEPDQTYRAMHQSILCGEENLACSFEEGLATLRLINAAERASFEGRWVTS